MKGRLIGRRATITVLFALMAVDLFIAILLIIGLSDFELEIKYIVFGIKIC